MGKMKFIAQKINGEIVHDFVFQLAESVRYLNWLNRNDNAAIIYSELEEIDSSIIGVTPVGTVEFVEAYMQKHYGSYPLPINIPEKLMDVKYTKRKVLNGNEHAIWGRCFVKSRNKIKSFTEITISAPSGDYQISDVVNIQSEYRCFVYKNILVGIQNYSGDFCIFPDPKEIKAMIRAYSGDAPIAYTLDVGVNENGTFVIEVHNFYSCGLYGFSDNRIFANMLNDWFAEYVKNAKK